MKNLDHDIRIAFSIHSSPGVYALLLGSGISRSAGIPTGWEVVLDLTGKLAVTEGESFPSDPEKWYIEKCGEAPDYAILLDKLTKTPAERTNLLRQYFEPDEHDLEEGLKVPTLAHKFIARLVKCGYIRMILTTNFDRLLEKAIEGEGITPVVISTDDSMNGAMPYVHNQCTIIKLHGDYMDTRIKNTPEELAHYSDVLNVYIDRVFDDFGLIICGWSADYDEALRNALYRRKDRRFSTFWTVRGQLGDEATRLFDHLNAEKVSIEGADEFFSKLSDNVGAIRDFGKSHPLSTDMAVAKVKKYLSEEKYSIRLHDLIMEELDRVCSELSSGRFETNLQSELTSELYIKRVFEYEELMKTLIKMLTTLVYFDNGKHSNLIKEVFERILNLPKHHGGYDSLIDLQQYPALLMAYAIGVVSFYSYNYDALVTIYLKSHSYYSHTFQQKKKVSLLEELYTYSILKEQRNTEISNQVFYIARITKYYVAEHIPDEYIYEEIFDIFEYIIGIMYIDLQRIDPITEKIYAPGYRLARKYYLNSRNDKTPREKTPDFVSDFFQTGLKEGKEWSLLKVGFLNGSPEKLETRFNDYKKYLLDWGSSLPRFF